MSLPNDKDFEVAVDRAIDEIFGAVEAKTTKEQTEIVEDDSLKTSLELEPLEIAPKEENEGQNETKIIDFPQIDEIIEPNLTLESEKTLGQEGGLTQEDLEKLAAALLGLEWEVTPETSFEFLTALEEAKEKAAPELHPIFDLLHEVGSWLKDRPEEARPEWLHFLHQGIVALNLIVVHGKESAPYFEHLKKALAKLKKASKTASPEEQFREALIRQLLQDYQRFLMFAWLFSRSPKTKPWQDICQKALRELEETFALLPQEEQPDLKALKEKVLNKLNQRKKTVGKKIMEVKKETEPVRSLPFRKAYQCLLNDVVYLVPENQVAYLGPFKAGWAGKIDNEFPLKLLLGFWVYFSFVKLKNKLTGPLAEKNEQELRRLSLPIIKRSENPQIVLILWHEDRGGVILAEEANFFEIPEEAYFVSKGQGGVIFIKNREFPVIKL